METESSNLLVTVRNRVRHITVMIDFFLTIDYLVRFSKNTGVKEEGWEHFGKEFFLKGRQKISGLQRGALYFPGTGMETKIPLAAPWDKVYRKNFLTGHRIEFRQELKVLDDMVFNMEQYWPFIRNIHRKAGNFQTRFKQLCAMCSA